MIPEDCISNGLGSGEVAVWSKLSPGISPSEWASLCRFIGSLSPGEFSTMASLVSAHQRFKNAVKRQVGGVLGYPLAEDIPLVSAGPSGIGGAYQKEITLKPAKVQTERQKQYRFFAQMV